MAAPNSGGLSIPVPADRRLYWALFLNSQLLVGVLYVALTAASVASLRLVAYAALWINVGVWVVANSRPNLTAVSTRTRRRALLVATATSPRWRSPAGSSVSAVRSQAASGSRRSRRGTGRHSSTPATR
jgi:hypothetical protein